ncbi:hypothetical protein ACPZMI_04335 [Pseudomonas wayambapalatensis]|uniref:hypothetical protein n=1 Tax=Pseudomonas wayambapalatensis TaxID=485895 RepID=UPI003CE94E52
MSNVESSASEVNRYGANEIKPSDRNLMVQRVLGAYVQRGSGTLAIQQSVAPALFQSTMEGRTENLVNLPSPVGVPELSSLIGGISQ